MIMIKFCNLIYFNLYKLGLLINEISVYPINNFLFKNNKKGEEVIKAVKEVSENKKNGIKITLAGIHFYALVYLFILGSINSVLICLQEVNIAKNINDDYLLLLLGVPSYIFAYFLIDYKDRYLDYFKYFEMFTTKKKRIWALISLLTVIFLWFWGFGSLILRLILNNN